MTRADRRSATGFRRMMWRQGAPPVSGVRLIPEEIPIALVHDGSTTAVMMATPADLEDFGIGFSLCEGVIERADQIRDIEVIRSELGAEVRMWLDPTCAAFMMGRRRRLAGPTGCGLCGIESLEEASRAPKRIEAGLSITAEQVGEALAALNAAQRLGPATRAVHAAGYWTPDVGLLAMREDVGRHNALDKLAGALRRQGLPAPGAVVLTSRVSVEMVQKSAAIGAPIIIAISAPTALAVQTAETAGVTLIAVARDDAFEVFSHHERLRH